MHGMEDEETRDGENGGDGSASDECDEGERSSDVGTMKNDGKMGDVIIWQPGLVTCHP